MTNSLVILFLLGMTAIARAEIVEPVSPEIVEEFNKWKIIHNKVYLDGVDEENRLLIFADNFKKIKKIQEDSKSSSYKVGLTKFADITTEEFKITYLGTQVPHFRSWTVLHLDGSTPIPDSVDWRNNNSVTSVKYQGACGSSWAFATTGALEGLYSIKTNKLKTFSEQQLIDCSTSYGTYGCNGGVITSALKYTRDYGIESASQYPYVGVKQACQYNENNTMFKPTGWISVAKNDQHQLAAAVAKQPITAAIEADATIFQFYVGGIIDSTACGSNVNHGVLIVGYGSENGQNYWIVKNSWGSSWGEAGYIRIAKGHSKTEPGVCGIASMCAYPTA